MISADLWIGRARVVSLSHLECSIILPAQTNTANRSIWCEKGFNIEMSALSLLSESFRIDGTWHALRVHQCAIVHWVISELFVEWHFARDFVIVIQVEEVGVLNCISYGAEWLEMAHTFEIVDCLQFDWSVAVSASRGEKVGIYWKI